MSTILVTGGAGFIGSHTCVELFYLHYLAFALIFIVTKIKAKAK